MAILKDIICMLIVHLTVCQIGAVDIDNGVEGDPKITCGAVDVSFSVMTRKPFNGKIFVKGEYGKPECTFNGAGSITGQGTTITPTGIKINSTGSTVRSTPLKGVVPTPAALHPITGQCPPCPVCNQDDPHVLPKKVGQLLVPNTAQLVIPIGTCNMKRERSLNPAGVTLTLTVVVSFHQLFITKVDRAYQVRCFYMEADKTVTSVMDVSGPQTTEIIAEAPLPSCSYSIRRTSPDGPEIQYAKVGDTVFHRWQCSSASPAMFGMLVHSCYVDDGAGRRIQVINRTGCSMDTYVISDLNYESSLYAYVEAHVFKFADRAILDFQCAINICIKEGDGCKGITPPTCGIRRAKRSVNSSEPIEYGNTDDQYKHDWDLHAQRLTIIDLDDNIRSEDLADFEKSENIPRIHKASLMKDIENDQYHFDPTLSKRMYCLSVTSFGILVSSCTFVMTISVALLATFYFLRQKQLT